MNDKLNFNKVFNHSGNFGDVMFSLHFAIELIEYLNSNISEWEFHLQTNQPAKYCAEHPYGKVMLTTEAAQMIKPLIQSMGFKEVSIDDNCPLNCVNLSSFRKMRLNLSASDLRSLYYSICYWHLPQDFTRNLFEHIPSNKHNELADRIILIHTNRYNNYFIQLKALEAFRDELMFMGMKSEYDSFCKNLFNVDYLPIGDFLDAAEKMKSAKGVIGNQSGLYSLAEMLKVPRILLPAEFNLYQGNRVFPGPCNVNTIGGWIENVRTQERLLPSVQNLLNRR